MTLGFIFKYMYLGSTGFIFLLTGLLRAFNMLILIEALHEA